MQLMDEIRLRLLTNRVEVLEEEVRSTRAIIRQNVEMLQSIMDQVKAEKEVV